MQERIKFTTEVEETLTNRYLNATSYNHPGQVHSVMKTLISCSMKLVDSTNRDQETKRIQTVLQISK